MSKGIRIECVGQEIKSDSNEPIFLPRTLLAYEFPITAIQDIGNVDTTFWEALRGINACITKAIDEVNSKPGSRITNLCLRYSNILHSKTNPDGLMCQFDIVVQESKVYA